MIELAGASWNVSSGKVFLHCSRGKLYWSFYVFAGEAIKGNEDLDIRPRFYSDYFAPLSGGDIKPLDAFSGLVLPNADEYQTDEGVVVFGCYVGSHEHTKRNKLKFGAVAQNRVDLQWTGLAPVSRGSIEGLKPFSVRCSLKYTGVQVKDTTEEDARRIVQSVDPIRRYGLEPQGDNLFQLVPE